MQKLIVLKKQLNNCEWEIEVSSYDKEVIEKAKNTLRKKGIKFKTEIYQEVINKHPYRIKFTELNSGTILVSISSNILKCLENEEITNEEVVIRKTKEVFTVYLWEISEVKALDEAHKLYRLHKEHFLRKSV